MTDKVLFMRWAIDGTKRRPIAVDPKRVDVIEHYQDEFGGEKYAPQVNMWWDQNQNDPARQTSVPACTKIIMQGKQEYMVQGTVPEVTDKLNGKR